MGGKRGSSRRYNSSRKAVYIVQCVSLDFFSVSLQHFWFYGLATVYHIQRSCHFPVIITSYSSEFWSPYVFSLRCFYYFSSNSSPMHRVSNIYRHLLRRGILCIPFDTSAVLYVVDGRIRVRSIGEPDT